MALFWSPASPWLSASSLMSCCWAGSNLSTIPRNRHLSRHHQQAETMDIDMSKEEVFRELHNEISKLHEKLTCKYKYLFQHHSLNWWDHVEYHQYHSKY